MAVPEVLGRVPAVPAVAGEESGGEEVTKALSLPPGLWMFKTEPVLEEEGVDPHAQTIKALSLGIVEVMKESLEVGSFFKDQIEMHLPNIGTKSPAALADLGASLTTAGGSKLQAVLEEPSVEERLRLTLTLLKTDLETTRVMRKISEGIEKNVGDSQKRFFLNEQLKLIKEELGMDKDKKTGLAEKFRLRLEDKVVPPAAQTLIDESMEKLGNLEPASSEFSVVRNHLDWLTQIPWGKYSEDALDLARAKAILDEDHCGLEDVKGRVLEFIAVSKLRSKLSPEKFNSGNIILLAGPPGTGKTSVARSIARALGRNFTRFSVGGLGDVSEIKGHRRTYVGAMPGRLIVALKTAQTSNCVICVDEIDKLAGFRGFGSPSSALLETLDPEQNGEFLDNYIDTSIDLSKVLFICTANSLDTIPGPLLDRMQKITLRGYILEEKKSIAQSHLIPTALKEAGLSDSEVVIEESAIVALARDYCREAGVRNLKKHIERILRKAALRVATADEDGESGSVLDVIRVTDENLESFVGKAIFSKDNMYESETGFPPGVAKGLAWTELDGRTLYIEAVRIADRATRAAANSKSVVSNESNSDGKGEASGDGRIKLTGNVGDVMRESSDIAFSYVRSLLQRLDPTNNFFDAAVVHCHVPDGGTPKDGPSAGCAMVSAMLSLSRGVPVAADVAMTGEISLTGKVLPVGGILSKVIAAKESGVTKIIMPSGNRRDWAECPDFVREGLEVYFADNFEDHVLPVAFPDLASQKLPSFPQASVSSAAAAG